MLRRTLHLLLFVLVSVVAAAQAGLTGYEYWLDSDYGTRQTGTGSSEDISLSISLSDLSPGIHYLNFRGRNSDNEWSSIYRYLFYISTKEGGDMTRYESWLDNDYAHRTQASHAEEVISQTVNINGLEAGIHYYNVRSQNALGEWSSIYRYLFFISTKEGGDMTRYESWLDNDYAHRTQASHADELISQAVDISGLEAGVHYYNVRSQNALGEWSSIYRYLFLVPEQSDLKLQAIEYWLDDDTAHATRVVTNEEIVELNIAINQLSPGVHYLNYRLQDSTGAWGFENGMEFNIEELETVATPFISHEGNRIVISTSTPQATIYYTLDGTEPDSSSLVYDGSFEVTRNCTIKAIAMRENYYPSEIDSLLVDWFKVESIRFEQNGEYLTMTTPTPEATIFYSMTYTESQVTQTPTEPVRNGYVLHMPYSCTVYAYAIKDGYENSDTVHFVYTEPIAEYAYDGYTLRVSGEGRVSPVLSKLGNEASETLCAIIWDVNTPLTEELLQGITNPNLLIYVTDASLASAYRDNVIVNGQAKYIKLKDTGSGNCNFYCPQTFTAEMVSYTREFSQKTQVGVSRGWETLALPFTVQAITHEMNATLKPFGAEGNGKPFWLRRLGSSGLTQATRIEANVPYIISMPNNSEAYPAEYNQAGKVAFSAENVTIPVTEPVILAMEDSTIIMVPVFQRVSRSSDVWAINIGEMRGQYLEGSVFERDYRDVRPFEAYIVHKSNSPASHFIPIMDIGGTTGIDVIENDTQRIENWYLLDGRKVQEQPKKKGVYISGKRKVIVR